MTVHIEEMVTEVSVLDGDLPLTQTQLEKIADFVIARFDQRQREQAKGRAATQLRTSAQPESPVSEVM